MRRPMSNPLLENYPLPPFSEIKPEHVEPAVTQAISQARQAVDKLLTQVSHPTWETLVEPMEDIDVSIDRVWSPVSHMNSVVNSDELRKAYNACLPMLSEFGTELGQNEDLYRAYKQLAESEVYPSLDTAQKKVIDNAVRDFRLSGVELNQADRDEYKNITQKLTELSAKFEENLMQSFSLTK